MRAPDPDRRALALLVSRLARVALVVGLAAMAAGCSGSGPAATGAEGPSPSSTAAPGANGTATATKPSAPTSPSANGPESPDASSQEFRAAGISFEYPIGWHTRQGSLNPGGNEALVFVGPTELPSDCVENAQGGACRAWPLTTLGPNGGLFAWRWWGRPGLQPPTGGSGDPTTVDGQPATVTKGPANADCQALGGDESIVVTVLPAAGASGWYTIEACLDGPDRSSGESAFEAMLASATIP